MESIIWKAHFPRFCMIIGDRIELTEDIPLEDLLLNDVFIRLVKENDRKEIKALKCRYPGKKKMIDLLNKYTM